MKSWHEQQREAAARRRAAREERERRVQLAMIRDWRQLPLRLEISR